MIRTFSHTDGELSQDHKPLGEVVHDTLKHWHEASGPQLFWFTDSQGTILATLLRGETEDDAIITYSDGSLERYNVKYHLTAEGFYDRTEIVRL